MKLELKEKLDEIQASTLKKSGKTIVKKMQDGVDAVAKLNLIENLQAFVGKKLPEFSLETSKGRILTNADLKDETFILSFYRGSWCPYCIAENSEYDKFANQFNDLGIKVVLISPELMAQSQVDNMAKIRDTEFASDVDNKLANSLGITFQLDPVTKAIYKLATINVKRSQGNKLFTLPIPATLIVKDGILDYFYADYDYKKRKDPTEIIAELSA